MKNIKYWATSFLLLLCLGCEENNPNQSPSGASNAGAEQVSGHNLKFDFSEERSFMQKEKHKQTMTFLKGTDLEDSLQISMTISRKFNLSPKDKDNGINLTMTFVAMQGECTNRGDVVWAYDKSGIPSEGASLPNMIGKRTDFRIDANTGQVLEVRNSEEVVNSYQKIGKEGELTQAWIRAKMNPEWYVFPDGPVEIGKSWTRTHRNPFEYQIEQYTTYTLAKLADGKAVVKSSSKVSALPESKRKIFPNYGDLLFCFDLAGENTGELTVDAQTGLPISRTTSATFEGDHIALDPQGKETSRTPVHIKTEAYAEYSY